MSLAAVPDPDLRAQLLDARIAGDVATPREDNLRNAWRMAHGMRGYDFGITFDRQWSPDEVLAVMARRCGVHPDPAYVDGPDTIDVDLTLAALGQVRDRLATAGRQRQRVLLATGHPTGIMVIHLAVAAALRAAGATVLAPPMSWEWPWSSDDDYSVRRPRHVRSVAGVHVLATGGDLLHTHAPQPGRALLGALERTGQPPPDLVMADHGWAGVAASAGIDTLGFADCNDPALFVGQEQGLPLVVVPLDDNVLPPLYDPLIAYLVEPLT